MSQALSIKDIEKLPPKEAIEILDTYLKTNPKDEEAYILRGMNQWKLNNTKAAIDDYLSALEINPESRAKTLLDYTTSILDFYSKDLLNP